MPKPSAISHPPSTVFNDYARYYDLLYQDKDYQAEADYVAALTPMALSSQGPIHH